MDNESVELIPPELRVSVDTEIRVEGLKSPADQQRLQSALAALPGVESLVMVERRFAIRYDPERVTKTNLCCVVTQSGFEVSEVTSASASPSIDAPGDDDLPRSR
jgi:hypothetical protein